ncbi:hypothetical protein VCR14J2_390047 [Vibrio coralliirubri]|uniref:Uncharacterized protein n=1 Tax=Vibrio coralliirubri TaxID=1516159 RepID=A0AA86XPK3_9VIBR|nr:hypothetical protein VCR1J2_590289 [Vibrio coralliirubri]CDT64601.1 hypothetical protein VCR31J2_1270789 [Vibrio coralliirubri]CDT70666.1 hypothetical protein VCR15J2_470797 [Vibrio coralliirubri]CDT96790.1 hypothetical protein VCR3J2_420146 [Vibrio coralliirubri]CDU02935.1 hypothetical protein VCR8J2_850267 [Vibrio coralliirubri]
MMKPSVSPLNIHKLRSKIQLIRAHKSDGVWLTSVIISSGKANLVLYLLIFMLIN